MLCLLFLLIKPKGKPETRVFRMSRLGAHGRIRAWRPLIHLLQNASCKNFWDHKEKANLILLMENENPCSIYETWRGSSCSHRDTEKDMGQGPRTLSLLSIMFHSGGMQTCQRAYIRCRCLQRSEFTLCSSYGNTSCLWNHGVRGVRRATCSDIYLQWLYKSHYFQRRTRWKQPVHTTRLTN